MKTLRTVRGVSVSRAGRGVASLLLVLATPSCGEGEDAGASVDAGEQADTRTPGGDLDSSSPAIDAPASDAPGTDAARDTLAPPVDAVAGTPPAEWVSITHELAGLSSECGNVNGVFPHPGADVLFAGIARQGLYSSTDGGESWKLTGTTGDKILNRASSIVFDPDHPDTFWYSGIYGWESPWTNSVLMTTDRGVTFKGYNALAVIQSSNDSIAVDLGDPDRKTLLSGGHEQKGVLFLSTDKGTSWKDIGKALPGSAGFCTQALVIDAKTFLVGCAASYSGGAGVIVRSTDGGASFAQVSAGGVVGEPLRARDGAIYWAAEGGGMFKSVDQGKAWTKIADGGATGGLRPIELPDGRIFSTKGKSIVVSADKGTTWKAIGKDIPFSPNALSYSTLRNAFYASYFTCAGANAVPADSIVRFGWDYRKE